MSSFRVYGMTECKALQLARASTAPKSAESVSEFEDRVTERFNQIMEGKRNVPLSQPFDAPQFARQFIEMAKRSGRARDLRVMYPKKVQVMRKNKAVMQTVWQEYVRD
ncbi:MAG: hypothetical protein ACTIJ4_01730 [Halomonas sp.]|uniref:hypothetical protein n=1 Tax=Halomonas sp. TaxID=1486246 RepID=UPI003F999D94